MKPLLIAADEIKEYFPDYDPSTSSNVHLDSAKIADKRYSAAVKHLDVPVVLLGGGAASGKTEYLSEYIKHFNITSGIYLDGTLPSFKGAHIKIGHAHKAGRTVSIHYVIPDSLKRAYTGFLNRDRKFATEHFLRTHSDSRKALLEIAQHYDDVEIHIAESALTNPNSFKLGYTKIAFASRQDMIAYLQSIQYTQKQIKNYLHI